MPDDYERIHCRYRAQTEKAVCVQTDDYEEIWIPKSIIRFGPDHFDCDRGEPMTLNVAAWFVEREL